MFSYLGSQGDFDYIIEIKDSGELGYAACDKLYSLLQEFSLLDDAVIGTFNAEVTEYMETNYPDMLRSASVSEVAGFFVDMLLGRDRPEGYYRFEALQIPLTYYDFIYLAPRGSSTARTSTTSPCSTGPSTTRRRWSSSPPAAPTPS